VRRTTLALAAVGVVVVAVVAVDTSRPAPSGPFLDVEQAPTAPPDAAVVPYERLSSDQRALFDRALSTDDSVELDGTATVDVWYETEFVRHDGTPYRVLVAEV